MNKDLNREQLEIELIKATGKNLKVFQETGEDTLRQNICISFRDGVPEAGDAAGVLKVILKEYGEPDILVLAEDPVFADDTDYLIRQMLDPEQCKKIRVMTPQQQLQDFDVLVLPRRLEDKEVLKNFPDMAEKPAVVMEPYTEFEYKTSPVRKTGLLEEKEPVLRLLDFFNGLMEENIISPKDFGDLTEDIKEGKADRSGIVRLREEIGKFPGKTELLAKLTEDVRNNTDVAFLAANPGVLDIVSFFCSLAPDSPDYERDQDGTILYRRIQRQKKAEKESRTFRLFKEDFATRVKKIAQTEPEKKEIADITEKILENQETAKLAGMDEDAFRENLTRQLVDIVMQSPEKYRYFKKFEELYRDFIKAAFDNRGLLKEE